MGITLRPPPLEADQTVSNGLRLIAETAQPSIHRELASLPTSDVNTPQEVFAFNVEDVANEADLRKARFIGWRYLVGTASSPTAAAEVFVNAEGNHIFGGLNSGVIAENTAKSIRQTLVSYKDSKEQYYLRLLRIPGLYLIALWLEDPSGTDILIPVAPVPPRLEAGGIYTDRSFLAALRPEAIRVLESQPPDRTSMPG
jgi:hypothetical protein